MKTVMKKILIAEDETFIAELYHSRFEHSGMRVVMAKDGEEAWDAIKREKPDIVLLDLNMPKLNGYDVLKLIRSDNHFKDLHVIILSNNDERKDIKEALALGANDYLVKVCFTPDEIVAAVKKSLEDVTQEKI